MDRRKTDLFACVDILIDYNSQMKLIFTHSVDKALAFGVR